jgi:hypothetical protein
VSGWPTAALTHTSTVMATATGAPGS